MYICIHQAFTEKFYGANVEGPSKCQNMHDSFSMVSTFNLLQVQKN